MEAKKQMLAEQAANKKAQVTIETQTDPIPIGDRKMTLDNTPSASL